MPKTRPQVGDLNWGQTLNDHLAQLQGTNGGLNTAATDPSLVADDEGYTYLNTQTGELRQWDGASWDSVITTRKKLTADTDFYIDPASGTDSPQNGNGTGVDAFASIQYGLDYIAEHYDLNGYQATINLPIGTFDVTNTINVPKFFNSTYNFCEVVLRGDSPTTTTINLDTGGAGIRLYNNLSRFCIRAMRFNGVDVTNAILADYTSYVDVASCHISGTFTAAIFRAERNSTYSLGFINFETTTTNVVCLAETGSIMNFKDNCNVLAGETLTMSDAFAVAFGISTYFMQGGVVINNNGTTTGMRFRFSVTTSVQFVDGTRTPDFFPGDIPGDYFGGRYQQYLVDRKKINENLTLYIDPVDGIDQTAYGYGTGTEAYQTLEYALNDAARLYDLNGYQIVFMLADGTYDITSQITLPDFVGAYGGFWSVSIEGSGYQFTTMDINDTVGFRLSSIKTEYRFRNISFNGVSCNSLLDARQSSQVDFAGCRVTGTFATNVLQSSNHSLVTVGFMRVENVTAQSMYFVGGHGKFDINGDHTFLANGTNSFSEAYINVRPTGAFFTNSSYNTVLQTGATVTGKRFIVSMASLVFITNGLDLNLFPGDVDGEITSSGYEGVNYSNAVSGLTSNNIQGAIDEVATGKLVLPGPFADDTAASGGGVGVGEMYYTAAGEVRARVV